LLETQPMTAEQAQKGALSEKELDQLYRRVTGLDMPTTKEQLTAYLVLRKNTAVLCSIEGQIKAPILAISLLQQGSKEGIVNICEKSVWQSYTQGNCKAYDILCKDDDHFVFLEKYQKKLDEILCCQ